MVVKSSRSAEDRGLFNYDFTHTHYTYIGRIDTAKHFKQSHWYINVQGEVINFINLTPLNDE